MFIQKTKQYKKQTKPKQTNKKTPTGWIKINASLADPKNEWEHM